MKTLISCCAPQGVRRLEESKTELGVIVELDALARFQSGLQNPGDGGRPSRPCETAMFRSAEAATSPMQLPSPVRPSPTPSGSNVLEDARKERPLALQESPDALVRTTKDGVEHLLALTKNVRNQEPPRVAETSSIDTLHGGHGTPEGVVKEFFGGSEELQPEPEYAPLRKARKAECQNRSGSDLCEKIEIDPDNVPEFKPTWRNLR